MSGTQGLIGANYLESTGNITRNKELVKIADFNIFWISTICVMFINT